MKYLSQFLIILGFTMAGEALQALVPLPIPASVWGIVLLFAALSTGALKVSRVREAGSFLTSILPVLFISPAVGILENWGVIRSDIAALAVLAVLTTLTTFAIAGRVTQALMEKEKQEEDRP